MCTKRARSVEPILISQNPILTEFVMMFVSPPHRHPTINAKWLRAWSYLPLPRVCLSWQIAQTLMRRRVLWRLISVYAVCICSFSCSTGATLNFRLATPLDGIFPRRPYSGCSNGTHANGCLVALLLFQSDVFLKIASQGVHELLVDPKSPFVITSQTASLGAEFFLSYL